MSGRCGQGGDWSLRPVAAGAEVLLFNHDSMGGGAGAGAALAGGVALAGSLSLALESPTVHFLAAPATAVGTGRLALAGPSAMEEWIFQPGDPLGSVEWRGTPGAYSIALTWVKPTLADGISGALLGLRPVASLEEGFRLASPGTN
jgi:hypothetical protein